VLAIVVHIIYSLFCEWVISLAMRFVVRDSSRFNMTRKVVQNRLPPFALLFDRIGGFAIEGHANLNTLQSVGKFNLRRAISESVFDQVVRHNLGVCAGEIKSRACILCLHARDKVAAHAQIYSRGSGVPVIGCRVSLFDVFGRCIGAPDLLDWRGDGSLDGYFHFSLLVNTFAKIISPVF
jgi:hypothetical protein